MFDFWMWGEQNAWVYMGQFIAHDMIIKLLTGAPTGVIAFRQVDTRIGAA